MATKEEVRNNNILKGVCAVLCVSLIGGYMYYVKHPEIVWGDEAAKYPERIVDIDETTDEDFKKILDNMKITTSESATINNNIINNDTEYDKNGNPILKEGASYTFKENGMGAPIEAPRNYKYGDQNEVINPNSGRVFFYVSTNKWVESDYGKGQAEINKMQDREVGKMSKMTDAQLNEFINNMTINMGSMK